MSAVTVFLPQMAQEADRVATAAYAPWVNGVPVDPPPAVDTVYATLWPMLIGASGIDPSLKTTVNASDLDVSDMTAIKGVILGRNQQAIFAWTPKLGTVQASSQGSSNTGWILGAVAVAGLVWLFSRK